MIITKVKNKKAADFLLVRAGSMMLFTANSKGAIAKIPDLGLESWQMTSDVSFAIEYRLSADLAGQLSEEGFTFADA